MKIYQLMKDGKIKEVLEYIKNKDIRGVSFLTVMDILVANQVDIEQLKKRGAIVEFDQLFVEGQKYLSSIEQQPVNDHECLKRLQEGIKFLVESWRAGTLNNESLAKSLDIKAIESLSKIEGTTNFEIAGQKYVNNKVQEKLQGIHKAWLNQKVTKTDSDEMDKVVTETLWGNWVADANNFSQHGKLQLQTNRAKIILDNYKSSKLTEETHKSLERKISDVLISQIKGGSIGEHEELSAALCEEALDVANGKPSLNMLPFYQEAIKRTLQKFIAGRLPGSVEKSLTSYVNDISLNLELQGQEKSEVEMQATRMMLSQYKQQSCPQVLQLELDQKIESIVMTFLYSRYSNDEVLQKNIKQEIIECIVKDWKSENLPKEVLKIMGALFLNDSDKLIQSINQAISPSVNAHKLKNVEHIINTLMDKIEQLQDRVEALETDKRSLMTNPSVSYQETTALPFGEQRGRLFQTSGEISNINSQSQNELTRASNFTANFVTQTPSIKQ